MQQHDTNCQFTLTFVVDLVAAFEMSDSNSSRWLCHYAISSPDMGYHCQHQHLARYI
jgi:hypothetical protein